MGSEEGRRRCEPGLVAELGGHGDTRRDMLGASTEVRASVHTVTTPSLHCRSAASRMGWTGG